MMRQRSRFSIRYQVMVLMQRPLLMLRIFGVSFHTCCQYILEVLTQFLKDQIVHEFPFFPRLHALLATHPNLNPVVITTGVGPHGQEVLNLRGSSSAVQLATPRKCIPSISGRLEAAITKASTTISRVPKKRSIEDTFMFMQG